MGLRVRNGRWYYRFMLDGHKYVGSTNLPATKQNVSEALRIEDEHRTALLEGRRPTTRVVVREFNSAVREFLEWSKARYRAHPNSGRRIAVSLASALVFFGLEVVSMIDEGRIEAYKTWRMNEHGVRDITVRHDLHALSTFFQYAIKQHWTRDNPIRRVEIPSDADAVRMHVLTSQEEKQYFWASIQAPRPVRPRAVDVEPRNASRRGARPAQARRESGSGPATNPLRKIGGRAVATDYTLHAQRLCCLGWSGLRRCGVVRIGVESNSPEQFSQGVALMETLNAPDTARGEMTRIGKSVAIKGEVSCGEDLYIDGQVEGTIDPKGNRLIIGPNGSVKANVSARAVIVQGELEGTIHASDRVDLKQSAIVVGDITTQRISVEEGAHLKGSINIQKEAPNKEGPGGIALSPSEAAQPEKK
jgi:cytoskeletal protein CcmA (bactofilin family)